MEPALTPTPACHSELAPGTAVSVRGDLPEPSTSWHRSPSTGHKKAKKLPSSQWHRGKPRAEARPMSDSPQSPLASRPPTHIERSSPGTSDQASPAVRMPSTQEALQAARDIMSMPVPGVPPMSVLRSRGKPPLGSPQSPPARYWSQSREHSRRRSPPVTVQGKVHVDHPRLPPDCLVGCHPTETLGTAPLQGVSTYGTETDIARGPRVRGVTAAGHSLDVDAVPAQNPTPRPCQGIASAAPGVDPQHLAIVGPPIGADRRAAATDGTSPPR
ncbi:hypothetical protein UY3_00653 [Chelonia mydas]|uniref:Uncharacterized protein n=1 Tax=Chelonia mydas TaxID=8469 RepID=M7CBI4_CHEMY|nr:hypothetical protein UY3_00653 [Chelonia mydas]